MKMARLSRLLEKTKDPSLQAAELENSSEVWRLSSED
jgi:hypothetical protein